MDEKEVVRCTMWLESHRRTGAYYPFHMSPSEILNRMISFTGAWVESVDIIHTGFYNRVQMFDVCLTRRDYAKLAEYGDSEWDGYSARLGAICGKPLKRQSMSYGSKEAIAPVSARRVSAE